MKLTHANWLLALGSILAMALVFEGGFRVAAHLGNDALLDAATDLEIEPPSDRPAELGHLIQWAEDPREIYRLKPHLDVLYAGARVKTNAFGFRGPAVKMKKPGGLYRILGIGDSFMFGYGVENDEPYLALLEDRLRRRFPGERVEVINTAVPGYNTSMEVASLRTRGVRFKPDLVLLEVVGNDLDLPNFIRQRDDVLALDRSYLFDFLDRRLTRHPLSLHEKLEASGFSPGFGLPPEKIPEEYRDMLGWPAFFDALRELRHLGRKYGFQILVISLAPAEDSMSKRALLEAERLGLRTVDVGAVYRRYARNQDHGSYLESPLAQSPDDGHPSAFGHRIAAQVLVRHLVEVGLFPLPHPPTPEAVP